MLPLVIDFGFLLLSFSFSEIGTVFFVKNFFSGDEFIEYLVVVDVGW